jgi:peptidoglycan/xylan/chitin deacetylase (PgdA/CDA1 family)
VSVPFVRRLRRAGGQFRRRLLSRQALILLYHRIAEEGTDPWQLTVTPQHFDEHLQVLGKFARPISLRNLTAAIRNGSLPRRSLIVTFDDGYADNLLNAKPLLEKHSVPSTVFVSTGHTGLDREFWWDELDRLFLQPGQLPRELSLSINGTEYRWELGGAAVYDKHSQQRYLGWRAWQEDAPTARHSVYRSLWLLMHSLSDQERRQITDKLVLWAGVTSSARLTHRTLTGQEIADLSREKLIEVGSHTVGHPRLSELSVDLQQTEIVQSKTYLEELLGQPVTSFAYPFGRESDYARETVELVQEAGFDCACTTSVGAVERGSDRFQLPRVHVQDMDGESFGRLCSEILGD